MDVIPSFIDWIHSGLAAYFEDVADAEQGRNFERSELISLGALGGSVMANILDNFLKLRPADRERLISSLQNKKEPR